MASKYITDVEAQSSERDYTTRDSPSVDISSQKNGTYHLTAGVNWEARDAISSLREESPQFHPLPEY